MGVDGQPFARLCGDIDLQKRISEIQLGKASATIPQSEKIRRSRHHYFKRATVFNQTGARKTERTTNCESALISLVCRLTMSSSPPAYKDIAVKGSTEELQVFSSKDAISTSSSGHMSARSSEACLARKYFLTAALFYSWVCLGLYAEVLGPSLTTLMHDIPASYEEIGRALSVREVGMFFGSLFGAVLADRFVSLRLCTISVTQVLGAITIFAVAWCIDLPALCATLFFSGFAHGALTSSKLISLGIRGCFPSEMLS
nr:unnamed protein product [Spirometra erinaceieuropaei]